MPVFVYDVEGWAWHAKARALAQEFGESGAAVKLRGSSPQATLEQFKQMVFFSPQSFMDQFDFLCKGEKSADDWETMRQHAFVGASFPAELPALAALAPKVAGIFVNNCRMGNTLDAIGIFSHFIPNGVDSEFWCPDPDASNKRTGPLRVGWVGNSRHHTHGGRAPHKGFSIVAEACARSGAVLIAKDTAGDYSGDSYWTREQIRDRIYRQIDVLAVASEMEGTPNPALEAISCGVPVVTTPVGDAADLIQSHSGGWIVDRCVESFALLFGGLTRKQCQEMAAQANRVIPFVRSWRYAADRMREMFAAAEQRRAVAP